jgi:Globin
MGSCQSSTSIESVRINALDRVDSLSDSSMASSNHYSIGTVTYNRSSSHDDFDNLTEADKLIIRRTWNVLKADGLFSVGSHAFMRILTTIPAVRQVFGFDGLTDEQILNNSLFRMHSARFMRPIDVTVSNLAAH